MWGLVNWLRQHNSIYKAVNIKAPKEYNVTINKTERKKIEVQGLFWIHMFMASQGYMKTLPQQRA